MVHPAPSPYASTTGPSTVPTGWMWLTLIPMGFGAWVPLVAGLRARHRWWTIFGAVVSAAWFGGFVLAGAFAEDNPVSDVGAGLIFLTWLSAVVFTFAYRDRYRIRVSALQASEASATTLDVRRLHREDARRQALADPVAAIQRGVGRPDLPGAAHGHLIDVNHAPVAILRTLPGIDAETAERIVATRDGVGLFSSIEDLAFVLDLPAGAVDRLRSLTIVLVA